jgi:enterochelin esterase family protein
VNTHHLLDPELAAVVDALPLTPVSLETLAQTRERVAVAVELVRAATPAYPAIDVTERWADGPAGAPAVRVLVYQPRAATAPRPGLLWIHGGGYVAGVPEGDDWEVKKIVDAVGCVVVSVDYRLAPETPHPGPVEDCYAALMWLHGRADELGVDRERIGIAGISAGGGLCAALALLARDRGEVAPCFQAPLQPMLDDRTAGEGYSHPVAGQFIWTSEYNRFGWSALLGREPGGSDVPSHAAAARAGDLGRLPPTYIAIGAIDLFIEEDVEFARRLVHAGVPTELHVYPGACHAFNLLAPGSRVAQAYQRDFLAALRRGLGVEAGADAAPLPNQETMGQLARMLPGIPPQDLPRFSLSLAGSEPYAPGPEAMPRPDIPRGELRALQCPAGAIYPGVPHDATVYVPRQLDTTRPARLIVFMDGARYLGPEVNVPCVLDSLITSGQMPPTVAVFVNPGAIGPGLPIYGGSDNRSIEYDSPGDAYARFLIDELLPVAAVGLNLSGDPAQRAICGLSSGGHCAFNAAFERPDAFGKVISHCGSFVDIRGGHLLASAVRRSERKPLKVFLQTGEHDLDIVFGHWPNANRELAAALAYRGYEHQLVVGRGGHSLAHGGAIFPDTLRWLWREGTP